MFHDLFEVLAVCFAEKGLGLKLKDFASTFRIMLNVVSSLQNLICLSVTLNLLSNVHRHEQHHLFIENRFPCTIPPSGT